MANDIQQEQNPTTQQHDLLANQLMLDLEFEWNPHENRWYPQTNFVLQGQVTDAVKKLLEANTKEINR